MTVAVLCGLLGGYGLVRLLRAALGEPVPSPLPRSVRMREVAVRGGVALAAAAVVAGLTSWPAVALLVGPAAFVLPRLYTGWRRERRREAQLPALVTWVEMLRDALAAGAGIETTIRATAGRGDGPEPPEGVANEVRTLVAGLDSGQLRLDDALCAFADEIDDADADEVIGELILASRHHAGKLVEQLTRIAEGMRDWLSARERITTGLDRVRTQVVLLFAFLGLGLIFEAVFQRSYLSTFGTAQGQVVLGIACGLFIGGGAWLVRMARPFRPPRLLTPRALIEQADRPPVAVVTGMAR